MYNVCLVRRRQLNASEEPPAGYPFDEDFADATTIFDSIWNAATGADVSGNWNSTGGEFQSTQAAVGTVFDVDLGSEPLTLRLDFVVDTDCSQVYGVWFGARQNGTDSDLEGGLLAYVDGSAGNRVRCGYFDVNGLFALTNSGGANTLTDDGEYYIVGTYTNNGTQSSLDAALYTSNGTEVDSVSQTDRANAAFTTHGGAYTFMFTTGATTLRLLNFTAVDE